MRPIGALDVVTGIVWVVWMILLATQRTRNKKLDRLLRSANETGVPQPRREKIDILEPYKWYFRMRKFIRTGAQQENKSAEITKLFAKANLTVTLFEWLTVLLAAMILFAMAQGIARGTFTSIRH